MQHHETDSARTTPTRTRGRRRPGRVRTIVAACLAALLLAPFAAWASHQFTDVPNSNTFHADIDWLADNGITQGCNPPANTRFCPKDEVTREQMAAFMHRLETRDVFLPGDSTMVPIVRFNIVSGFGVDDVERRAPVTADPTAAWDGTRWVVDVPGQNVNLNFRQAICIGVGSTPIVVTVGSIGGDLLVYTHTVAGADTQGSAQCTLYADA